MNEQAMAIQVQGLHKTYGNTTVLRDVNFSVKQGTIFSLLGSNGAGKTTTVKILTTLVNADRGGLHVCGYDVQTEAEQIHADISLTGQFASVDEMMTGMENLVVIGRLHAIDDPRKRAKALLQYFDLEEAGNRLVSTYSGGMRRKLDIAMSLVNHPRVLFLDEPTTGLDPQSRRAMWEIIEDLKQQGTTIFLTTQYLEEAEELADDIAILHQGAIIVQGTVQELKRLLPQEVITFVFSTAQDFKKAQILLDDPSISANDQALQISVTTCEAMKVLTDAIQAFSDNQITLEDVIRKSPSLEDVFLALVDESSHTS